MDRTAIQVNSKEGMAWNKNLESYADYSNRIGRGPTYVRQGQVLHLNINRGTVSAMVAGSSAKPYNVNVSITKLSPALWKDLINKTRGQIDSLQSLLTGEFPKNFESLFTDKKSGLFPSPCQIKFECDCPDWASMCKYIAATLYEIGARLDNNPKLFFTLRGVKIDDLVGKALAKTADKLSQKSPTSKRRLKVKGDGLNALFGISVDDSVENSIPTSPTKKNASTKSRAKPKAVKKGKN